MTVEFYILVIPFCVIPVFLVSLDYFNKSAEIQKRKRNVIDFDKFIKHKEEGDAVDIDISDESRLRYTLPDFPSLMDSFVNRIPSAYVRCEALELTIAMKVGPSLLVRSRSGRSSYRC